MFFSRVAAFALAASTAVQGMTIGGKPGLMVKPYKREVLQDIVTWDEVPIPQLSSPTCSS